jgi:CRISPR/Cas system-associated exonuclease Cas4 (RecB family)
VTPKQFDRLISKSKAIVPMLEMAKVAEEEIKDALMNNVIDTLDEMEEIITTNW